MRVKLRDMRVNNGYTQYSLAEKLNISRSHYSQIESGEKNPSDKLKTMIKIALRYTEDDLFDIATRVKPRRGNPYIREHERLTLSARDVPVARGRKPKSRT